MRVLVTRPEPGASATAARLAERGHEPVLVPLSRVVAVEPQELADSARFDGVAVTSANAMLCAAPEIRVRHCHLPCFAVGERTAAAAREVGFTAVASAGGDARKLAALIGENAPACARLLYLCGTRRRPELEALLGAAGCTVTILETYATEPVDPPPADLGRDVDAILLFSPFAAERLAAVGAQFDKARVLCMSTQIADALSPGLRQRAEIAVRPEEEALLALLGRAP